MDEMWAGTGDEITGRALEGRRRSVRPGFQRLGDDQANRTCVQGGRGTYEGWPQRMSGRRTWKSASPRKGTTCPWLTADGRVEGMKGCTKSDLGQLGRE